MEAFTAAGLHRFSPSILSPLPSPFRPNPMKTNRLRKK